MRSGDFKYVITVAKYVNFAIYEHFKKFCQICFCSYFREI